MTETDFKAEMLSLREKTEKSLDKFFLADCPQSNLLRAMRYSLLSGGKRIRAILVLKFCQAAGGKIEDAMPFACAIEMLHAYSLIHDDLPCMDDDELRRGKPTCHVVFGEAAAALAGDALQSAAFETVLSADLPAASVVKAASVLARAAGEMGMCGGQELDINGTERRTAEYLTVINDLKTGALIRAACVMGVTAACADGDGDMLTAADEYGKWLARAFQVRDDVLDVVSTDEALGKSVGSDALNGKLTFADIAGIDGCGRLIEEYSLHARSALLDAFEDCDFLCTLADSLASREN